MDFVEILPHFINSEIFLYLKRRDLLKAQAISKLWFAHVATVLKMTLIWPESPSKTELKRVCMESGVCIKKVKLLYLASKIGFDEEIIDIITTNCKHIETLEIDLRYERTNKSKFINTLAKTQRNFKHLAITQLTKKQSLRSISTVIKSLESFNLRLQLDLNLAEKTFKGLESTKLKILTIHLIGGDTSKSVELFQSKFPNLNQLNMLILNSIKYHVLNLSFKPNHVRFFKYSSLSRSSSSFEFFSSPKALSVQLDLIEDLIQEKISLLQFVRQSPKINKFSLGSMGRTTQEESNNLITSLTSATVIEIQSLSKGSFISYPRFPNGKVLSIYNSSQTMNFMVSIASSFPVLKELRINFLVEFNQAENIKFPFLTEVQSFKHQTIEFWDWIVASAPKLKKICVLGNDPNLNTIKAKFVLIQVSAYEYSWSENIFEFRL